MAEYIEREAVKAAVRKRLNNSLIIGWLISIVNEVPAVDVAPVVHGRWVPEYEIKEMYYSPDDIERYKVPNGFSCSVCTKWNSARTNYCPNCGARMDGE